MFHSKTTFIIGAGASKEANLPLGNELTEHIKKLVDVAAQGKSANGYGDFAVRTAIGNLASKTSPSDFAEYEDAALAISQAMMFSRSIDEFIYTHNDNKYISTVAKLSIARAILAAERASHLYSDPAGDPNAYYNQLTDKWYIRFFKAMVADISKTYINTVFDKLAFVVFNYDRCLESFLTTALSRYYRVTQETAAALVSRATIIHVYGDVGTLPRTDPHEYQMPFGGINGHEDLAKIATRIKTYSEDIEDLARLARIRELIRVSERLVFLGFAFHEANMNLLTIEDSRQTQVRSVYATTKNFSSSDQNVIKGKVKDMLRNAHADIECADIGCGPLFDQYSLSITN